MKALKVLYVRDHSTDSGFLQPEENAYGSLFNISVPKPRKLKVIMDCKNKNFYFDHIDLTLQSNNLKQIKANINTLQLTLFTQKQYTKVDEWMLKGSKGKLKMNYEENSYEKSTLEMLQELKYGKLMITYQNSEGQVIKIYCNSIKYNLEENEIFEPDV